MKKCPSCNSFFSDEMMRCPDCERLLIPDLVSDLEANRTRSRRQFVAVNKEKDNKIQSVQTQSSLKPGNIVDANEPQNTVPVHRLGRSGVVTHPMPWFIRLLIRLRPYLRIIISSLLIIVAIIGVVLNWASIKPVLTCMGVGAIIGGGILTYLTRRHFNPNTMTVGAVVGAILALILQYNILGIGTEIGSLIYALGPIFIMFLGLWIMLTSITRH